MKTSTSHKKVTTSEIMDFLVEHMVTKAELEHKFGTFRSDIIDYIDRWLTKQSIELSKIIDKTDMKADRIVDALLDNKLITTTQAKKIHALSLT